MWDLIKQTDRFNFVNQSKIEHVVFFADIQQNSNIWFYEDGQTMAGCLISHQLRTIRHQMILNTKSGVSAVKRWVSTTDINMSPDDILISADVDEVLSREALHHLQYCHLVTSVISGAVVMPMGNLDMAFR